MRGNYETHFRGGQNLTAVEGNASVYQVNPVSRITGEGRAECLRTWGPEFDQEERGGGRQLNLCVKAINRTTSEERAEHSRGWGEGGGTERVFQPTSSGRIDVGVCYTRGTRSRRWCGWWGRRGRWGGGDE